MSVSPDTRTFEFVIQDEKSPSFELRTVRLWYSGGKVRITVEPWSEVSRFGMDKSREIFECECDDVNFVDSHIDASDFAREVCLTMIGPPKFKAKWMEFSYNKGELRFTLYSRDGSVIREFNSENVLGECLLDREAVQRCRGSDLLDH